MSADLRKNWRLLNIIAKGKTLREREAVLNLLKKKRSVFKALRECCKNLLNKKILIKTRKQYLTLCRHKKKIKNVARKSQGIRSREKSVVQSAGFLPVLIPLIASIIGEAIKNGVREKNDS